MPEPIQLMTLDLEMAIERSRTLVSNLNEEAERVAIRGLQSNLRNDKGNFQRFLETLY